MTSEPVVQNAATIFDSPLFVVICPKCKTQTTLEAALDKDRGYESDPFSVTKVVCPHCHAEEVI